MNEANDLSCRVYVDAPVTLDELAGAVAATVAAPVSGTAWTKVISLPPGEIDVLENDEFDEEQRKQFSDGFLFYRYYVEFYTPAQGWHEVQDIVARVLEHLWSKGYPAVASCSYESELPRNGGYKSLDTPQVQEPAPTAA